MSTKGNIINPELIYPDLCYDIVGCAYEVFNELGSGHAEKTYQNALAVALKLKKFSFKEQVYYSAKFKGVTVGRGFLDFLVDEKVIVE